MFLKKQKFYIKEYSNVIQFDNQGYPLRLVIDNQGNQIWIDTAETKDDVILKWNKNEVSV